MNNRSFYMIISALCLVDMVLLIRPNSVVMAILRTIICGGALYYVVRRFRQPGITFFLMLAIAVLYNPVIPIDMELVWWLLCDIGAMAVFYLLARVTPISESGIQHHVSDDEGDR